MTTATTAPVTPSPLTRAAVYGIGGTLLMTVGALRVGLAKTFELGARAAGSAEGVKEFERQAKDGWDELANGRRSIVDAFSSPAPQAR